MEEPKKEVYIRDFFKAGVILKGVNGLLEIFVGALLLFSGTLTGVADFFIQNELVEDPHDFVANFFQNVLPLLSAKVALFGAIYLISHGLVKVFLIFHLLKNKLWSYPASIVFLFLFIVYQLYRFILTGSIWMAFLTIFDLILISLIWHEYQYVKVHQTLP